MRSHGYGSGLNSDDKTDKSVKTRVSEFERMSSSSDNRILFLPQGVQNTKLLNTSRRNSIAISQSSTVKPVDRFVTFSSVHDIQNMRKRTSVVSGERIGLTTSQSALLLRGLGHRAPLSMTEAKNRFRENEVANDLSKDVENGDVLEKEHGLTERRLAMVENEISVRIGHKWIEDVFRPCGATPSQMYKICRLMTEFSYISKLDESFSIQKTRALADYKVVADEFRQKEVDARISKINLKCKEVEDDKRSFHSNLNKFVASLDEAKRAVTEETLRRELAFLVKLCSNHSRIIDEKLRSHRSDPSCS